MIRENDKIYTIKELWDQRDSLGFKAHYLPEIQDLDGTLFMNARDQYYAVTGGVLVRYLLMDRNGNLISAEQGYSYTQLRNDFVIIALSCPTTASAGRNIVVEYMCFVDHINIEMISNADGKPECRIVSEIAMNGRIIRNASNDNGILVEDAYTMNELLRKYRVDDKAADELYRTFFE